MYLCAERNRYVTRTSIIMATRIHRDLPYKALLQKYRLFRNSLFTKERPQDAEYIKTDLTLTELQEVFGSVGYAPAWKFSYYKGEDLNLAYVYYDPDPERWKQYHVRAWDEGDYRLISCHDELTPEENPKDHLDGIGFRRQKGMREAKKVLERQMISYEMVIIND